MNYVVKVSYQTQRYAMEFPFKQTDCVPILNAASEDDAKVRAIHHVRSTVRNIVGGVTADQVQPLNCQGCGE